MTGSRSHTRGTDLNPRYCNSALLPSTHSAPVRVPSLCPGARQILVLFSVWVQSPSAWAPGTHQGAAPERPSPASGRSSVPIVVWRLNGAG